MVTVHSRFKKERITVIIIFINLDLNYQKAIFVRLFRKIGLPQNVQQFFFGLFVQS
jgi:hypothetical protein